MPQFGGRSAGVPKVARSLPTVRNFQGGGGQVFELPYFIAGTTKDAAGAPLGTCDLVLFRTADNSIAAQGITSDAGGLYSIVASPVLTHYLVAYKAGSPDVAGTTVDTLTAVPG